MSSNLPPGVTDSMLPGNRPEDEAFDHLLDSEVGVVLEEVANEVAYSDRTIADVEQAVAQAIRQAVDRLTAATPRVAQLVSAVERVRIAAARSAIRDDDLMAAVEDLATLVALDGADQ